MEKKNPNIYQRALDIVNNRINPDIPQGGGGGSSDAVQYIPQVLTEAQQMQARKNQGLYYEEDTVGYLLEETTVVFEEAFSYTAIPVLPPIVVGEKYILSRDGVEWEVTAGLYYGAYSYVGFDPDIQDPPEEGPMVCLIVAETEGGTMVLDAEAGSHTYAIKGDMHVVSAIDKKYVQPVIDDYMTVIKPRSELIINWNGDVSEREKIWKDDEGWVKIADDFPDNAAWIDLSVIRYGYVDEDGDWHNQGTYVGSDMEYVFGCYVMGEWNLVFVSDESITIPGTAYTLTHGVWTYCMTYNDKRYAYYEIEFPDIEAPIMRFAGASGRGEHSFICGKASAALTTGGGSVNGGRNCEVSGINTAAFGNNNTVTGGNSFAVGESNKANAYCTAVEGYRNTAKGQYSHAEGYGNTAQFNCQHVQGQYNELYDLENVPQYDSSATYHPGDIIQYSGYAPADALHFCIKECTNVSPNAANRAEYWINNYVPLVHVVGWGTYGYPVRYKNIHTLDSLGNAMYTGDVTAKSMIIQSSTPDSTKKFKITVDDTGAITATEVT